MQLLEMMALEEGLLGGSKSPDYDKFIEMVEFIVSRGKLEGKFAEENRKQIERMKKKHPKNVQIKHTMNDVLNVHGTPITTKVSNVKGEDLMHTICNKFDIQLEKDWDIYGDSQTEVSRTRNATGKLGDTKVHMNTLVRLYKREEFAVWVFRLSISK